MKNALWLSTALILILHTNLLTVHQWITDKLFGVQIGTVEADAGNLIVLIGGVIIDSLGRIAATGVDRFLIKLSDSHTALLLCDGTQNMKYLADTGRLRVFGHGV